ncbi:MAG: DUF885 domain-containing protein [Chloroflexota bacterium]
MSDFGRLVDEFLAATWRHEPVEATWKGIHDYDHLLAVRSDEAMAAWGQALLDFQRRFEAVDPAALTRDEALDRRWALAVLDHELVTHDLELWRRSPYYHIQDLGSGLHNLLIGAFAPAEERLTSLLARLKAIPASLDAAQRTLQPEAVPPVWVTQGLLNAQSARRFVANDVPQAAAQVPAMQRDVAAACRTAAEAITDFETYLQNLNDQARGDYAIGRERFDRILKRFHMLDMDAQDLYAFGLEWIQRYERQMIEVARQIDPDQSWIEVLETVKDDHPQPQELRQAYEDETMLARRHCLEQDLITFPEGESCVLEWTPAFLRARAPIALPWVSPAFESGLASKWYITPIDPDATPERQTQHIRDNSWAWIRGIAMHEIYPGHHLQHVIAKLVATPLRKQFWSPVYSEGWGLYTEELFYETGLIASPEFRLMQLRNGLWRAVRIIVDTGLHSRGMSLEESAWWLAERARLEPRWAESETRHYTTRPTYPSSYQVGFAMLLELREKVRAENGAGFRLKDFHDTLMSYSSLPLRLVEEEMLG